MMNMMTVESLPVPLRQDNAGAIRIGTSRVLLELVVHAFQNGASPEEIVQAFDTLVLADVYAVLAWYLNHEEEVADYMRRNEEEAEAIRRKIEARQGSQVGLRKRLMARARAQGEDCDSPTE